ncbi:hypothetical protein AN928_09515 [Pseudomonas aeruginosa]|nr:hypothetical protein BMR72_21380 [Pseudomonas aeruginosa]OFQ75561.1 hypothetical protein HMPREF2924_20125 [Pseudomonas sp. HMSC063H08]OFQ95678.1 hypothetical protein HMPREF2914_16810 [Pseudomonas sp. HMSC067G02]KZM05228.1 hypothetical protein AN929_09545 [Pseudomonas aeruginosa]KZM11674.1 hypothetical protein AN928_09515 [Pseudomonas aeruginosa]
MHEGIEAVPDSDMSLNYCYGFRSLPSSEFVASDEISIYLLSIQELHVGLKGLNLLTFVSILHILSHADGLLIYGGLILFEGDAIRANTHLDRCSQCGFMNFLVNIAYCNRATCQVGYGTR